MMNKNLVKLLDRLGLHRLLRFWVVAEYGSYYQAAQALGVQDYNLISQMESLEHSLGYPLLVRRGPGNKPLLTGEGRELHRQLTPIFESTAQAIATSTRPPAQRKG